MSVSHSTSSARARTIRLGAASAIAFLALSAYVSRTGDAPKLVGISWVAFTAMAGAAALGGHTTADHPRGLVWGYGLASGAMIASAAAFLLPQAIGYAAKPGGFGVAAGILTGFGAHTIGHRLSHLDLPLDRTTAELSAHSLAAGSIIGVVYTAMPGLGPLLGLAIVSHKGPAGYAAARRLARTDRSPAMLLLPAAGVGIAALAVTVVSFPTAPVFRAVVFGFAAGIFLHVAMDFLPHCETGSDVHDAVTRSAHDHDHALLDRLRLHAVASTGLGAAVVAAAWVLLR
ncbi:MULTISPECIES: ZIP family metal transporter [Halobacterium]|uniref:ZIP family metal transporter n=1 Tax=Halobacterium TaxID=2239 RepID=UPI001963735B|nr:MULTISPECIES: ZIP family metal transporter [Halobacterium]MCF2164798.1 ZIP family metal transporter [Halobacterium salinarum]MCF2168577.1 ZIP family metal transporter [Halobacterium salinarum]MCF2239244.1 ZIP family metal transporter [Halobacterium salinarum]QRY22034.1 ZIP family metal transporter [Halobacterium sp. GSL-19]WJK63420.1 ZIP family metal transporter [Halobacterium salinarum]